MRALLVAILALVGLAVAATPAPDGITTITVQFTIRDVVGVYSGNPPSRANKTTHRDFERINQAETGVVLKRLGSDRKPVFNTGRVSATWTNQTLFDYVWRDVPGVTFTLIRNFDLKWNVNTALYEYSNSSFFPIDNAGFGNYGSTGHNFHFCLEYHTQFQYRGVETFSFTGDDDVYFFVNNILFVDLGGVHGAQSTTKDLRNPTVAKNTYEMDVGGIYNFDLFYCERHTSASNLKMATNIQLNNCPYLDECGLCSLTAPLTTVNPCATMNCNNGVCDCPTGTCICNDGWVDAPPTGGNPNYCSQKCGDGILQGDEQCDPPSACCSATCKFAAAGTTCPSSGQPCVQSVCPGTSAKCGVAYPIGTLCNGGNTAPACKQYQCTDASGSTCALVNNNILTCSDNNACTTDTCSNGVCVSSTTSTCPSTNCRNAGTCDATTGQCSVGTAKANGIGCGADPGLSFCVQPTCQSGTCTNTSKPAGTSCGSDTVNKCGTSLCDGNGACAIVPIVSATGTVANCPAQVDGMCTRQICDPNGSMACVTQNLQDGSACSNASLTPTSCQRFACSSGVCGLVSINEGNTCSDGAALNAYGNDACSKKICQSGACVIVANTSRNTESCDISSGANPELECREYKCNAGTCTSSNINERGTCTVGGTIDTPECQERRCVAGTCTVLSANAGSECDESENMGCKIWRCAAGECVSSSTAVNVPCDATNDKCNLKFCDGAGACVARPVVCDPDQCFGNLECQTATGICVAPSGGICCGNDVLDDGEECDDSTNPCCVNCAYLAADSLCGSDTCIEQTCQNVTNGEPQKTTCVSDADIRNGVACTNGPPVTNQCQELRCQSGTCAPQNKPNSASCNLSGTGFCNLAACVDGTCSIVPNAAVANADCSSAYGTVPECNSAVCSGTQCVLVSASESLPCTAINSTTCSDRVCKSGQCIYNYDAYPKSPNNLCSALATTNLCLLPGCDGSGGCIFLNATAGTACNIPSNPECNLPQCDGAGVCVLNANPAKIGQACTTARDLQCQVAKCDINGDCAVENVVDGTACVRTDVGECQDSMCQTGACVLVNTADTARVCSATSAPAPGEDRSCSNYFCQADGSCNTPSPKAAGTLCPDLNLCDVDVCNDAGVCVHTPSKQCDQPTQPCEVPLGICLSAYGNCTYGGRGQYASCTPRASELDQRCNASEVGAYRCATGAPDSPCVPSCFAGGVCGDGIVQAGEQCDWGDERTGGPCCNITCQWFAEQTPCNNTDATILAAQAEQAANLSKAADLPLYCFNTRCFFASSGKSVCTLGFDETVNKKCQPDDSGSSNRTAILASVIPGALLALLLAGAGFFFWRRAQKAAEGEWLQEYLNAGNVRVENNAAFVETQTNVNNAAFQPDGSN